MSFETLLTTIELEIDQICSVLNDSYVDRRVTGSDEVMRLTTEAVCSEFFRGMLRLELYLRQQLGERPALEEYLSLFPSYSALIRTEFSATTETGEPAILPATVAGRGGAQADLDETKSWRGPEEGADEDNGGSEPPIQQTVPTQIGRYVVERLLGAGNFLVYLAFDPERDCHVAIKVARPDDARGGHRMMSLATEAKRLGALKHPRFVKVYEYVPPGWGEATPGRDGFLVLEYVEGQTLEGLFQDNPPSPGRLAEILEQVSDSLQHAHEAGIFHRDLKPANILLDHRGIPRVCDFGLAMDEESQSQQLPQVAGTIPYMAPEQVRGEVHRIDGRTDVWALGVILYEGLTRKRPFPGNNPQQYFEEILHRDPKPPRMIESRVPRELQRICLRCLSRRMSDRYLTAADLAADLHAWEVVEFEVAPAPCVVSRGLSSYDVEDAAYFQNLLPGPRGRDGLAESVRHWKARIESAESDKTFSVGLLYGPSGGGKSSFVKAGLLPHLDSSRVRAVYLEATPQGTEERLLRELRSWATGLRRDTDLPGAVAQLRDVPAVRRVPKLLVVIDQFEQWLQAQSPETSTELVRALRQCDGVHVQTLVLVRDDFWMPVTRFFRAVEVPLVERVNSAAVELFDPVHARKVLEGLGGSLGRASTDEMSATEERKQFLDEAIQGLIGLDGRVIPVRLTLFVEVVRHRPWTRATLRELGGMEGIGVKFLKESIDAEFAPPGRKLHRAGIEQVLNALLPGHGSWIRGAPLPARLLREKAGLGEKPEHFAELMVLLERELRLVSATDLQGYQAAMTSSGLPLPLAMPEETFYQLAHDYLIRPVRLWLESKETATSTGRATLRLNMITAAWLDRPGKDRLPSFQEWASIRTRIRPSRWSEAERKMMRAADRRHIPRASLLGAVFILLMAMGCRGLWDRQEARIALVAAISADDRKLLDHVPQLVPYGQRVIPELEARFRDPNVALREREVVGMLLFRFAPTSERGIYLRKLLLEAADPYRVGLIRALLGAHPEYAGLAELQSTLENEPAGLSSRLRAGCALAALEPDKLRQSKDAALVLTRALLYEGGRNVPDWIELLGPEADKLVDPLGQRCRDELNPIVGLKAAEALAEVLKRRDHGETLARMMVEAHPEASWVLLHELASLRTPNRSAEYLRTVLQQPVEHSLSETEKDRGAERQARAAIGLEVLGEPDRVSSILQLGHDPRGRALLIHQLAAANLGRQQLIERLKDPQVESGERQALLMIWSETQTDSLAAGVRDEVLDLAEGHFQNDPDPGVHSAADLLLRRWGQSERVARAEARHRQQAADAQPMRWLLGPEGFTFAVIDTPGVFRMGSPEKEDGRLDTEQTHFRKIDHSFAMSTREVSILQFRAYDVCYDPDGQFTHDLKCSFNRATWFEAAAYCNWLSRRDGIPRAQWCYPEPVGPGMVLPDRLEERFGYRLPTEAEWEFACRAGTITPRFFGVSDELFPRYGWTWLNAQDRAWPSGQLLPNPYGMFDMLGNLWEWCQDGPEQGQLPPPYPSNTTEARPMFDHAAGGTILHDSYRVLRGGAFDYSPRQARAAYRYAVAASLVEGTFGFRVVRTLPSKGKRMP